MKNAKANNTDAQQRAVWHWQEHPLCGRKIQFLVEQSIFQKSPAFLQQIQFFVEQSSFLQKLGRHFNILAETSGFLQKALLPGRDLQFWADSSRSCQQNRCFAEHPIFKKRSNFCWKENPIFCRRTQLLPTKTLMFSEKIFCWQKKSNFLTGKSQQLKDISIFWQDTPAFW